MTVPRLYCTLVEFTPDLIPVPFTPVRLQKPVPDVIDGMNRDVLNIRAYFILIHDIAY